MGTLLFSFVATNLAGFSVPVEVGGARLAYAATASEAEGLSSYPPTTLPLPTIPLPTLPLPTYHLTTTDYLTITYHPRHHRLHLPPSNHSPTTYHPPPTLYSFTPAHPSPQVPSGSYLSAPAATSKAATRAEGDAPRG